MFQNKQIAKDFGQARKAEALANGATEMTAGRLGRLAEKAKLMELDKWTMANVGLD